MLTAKELKQQLTNMCGKKDFLRVKNPRPKDVALGLLPPGRGLNAILSRMKKKTQNPGRASNSDHTQRTWF